MGRVYTAIGENLTLGTGSVLLALRTATGLNAASLLKVQRVEVTQSGSTTSAQVRLLFSTRDTAGTLTTTSVTPTNNAAPVGGPASGLTGNTNVIGGAGRIGINSSADSGGTYANHWSVAPNQLGGYLYHPIPEERIQITPDIVWLCRFAAAPANLSGWTIAFVYEEVV